MEEAKNVKFSLTKDSQGRELSKEQQEYFKDSVIRDDNGRLKVLYHGTKNKFSIFAINKSGQSSKQAKVGFWFTETENGGQEFADSVWYGDNTKSEAMKVYLNVKKPKIYGTVDNTKEVNKLRTKIDKLKEQKNDLQTSIT